MAETMGVPAVVQRLFAAINAHDVDALVTCLALDYVGEQPLHPERKPYGREEARRYWRTAFQGTPGLQLTIIRSAIEGETVWLEFSGTGQRARDGVLIEIDGVLIVGLAGERIRWGRLYLEPHRLVEFGTPELPRD